MATEIIRQNIQNLTGQEHLLPAQAELSKALRFSEITDNSANRGPASLSDAFFSHAHETSTLFSANVTAMNMSAFAQRNEILMGTLSGSIEGVQLTGAALAKHVSQSQQQEKERSRKSADDFMFIQLVQRIDELNRELGIIRADIEALDAELRAEYGDNYMEVMAQTYLDDDELETLEGLGAAQRQERIEHILRDKMLSEDGTIKTEYQGLRIAALMEQLEKEEVIQTRVDRLEVALASDDPEAIEAALGNDELTDDTGQNLMAEQSNVSLDSAFRTAVAARDAGASEIVDTVERRDVEENADIAATFDSLETYGIS